MAKKKNEENKANEIWKVTISTDRFTERIKQTLGKRIELEPGLMFTVKGPAKKDFEIWLQKEYPKAKFDGEYYSLKDFCPPENKGAETNADTNIVDEIEIEDI